MGYLSAALVVPIHFQANASTLELSRLVFDQRHKSEGI
jgi:hypothetical protein